MTGVDIHLESNTDGAGAQITNSRVVVVHAELESEAKKFKAHVSSWHGHERNPLRWQEGDEKTYHGFMWCGMC